MSRPATRLILLVLVLTGLCACSGSMAFQFDLAPNAQRCFTEEVPSQTDLTITYASQEAYAQFLDTVLTDSQGRVLWTDVGRSSGTHELHVVEGGDYVLCFTSRIASGARVSKAEARRVVLDFKIGTENTDYKKLATVEKLKPIEVQLRALEDVVRSIHTEYAYFKEKEAEMRNTNERMTAKVMWLSISLIITFTFISYLQLRHLRRFFRKKRMID